MITCDLRRQGVPERLLSLLIDLCKGDWSRVMIAGIPYQTLSISYFQQGSSLSPLLFRDFSHFFFSCGGGHKGVLEECPLGHVISRRFGVDS